MKLSKRVYGQLDDGTQVDLYSLENDQGIKVDLVTYGARITAVETPDRQGQRANITLYRDSLADYVAKDSHLGCIAGRFATRIVPAEFTLDGTVYKLAQNAGPTHLHGGFKGFDKWVWRAEPIEGPGSVGVKFSRTSPDGEEGYPGTLDVDVVYTLNDRNELTIDYAAVTDRPTIINLSNHAYWNLAGAGTGDILDTWLTLNAEAFLPIDYIRMRLGPAMSVANTPADFRTPAKIGARIHEADGGYDHCFILAPKDAGQLGFCARAHHEQSGRVLEILTSEVGLVLYTGNSLDGSLSGGGVPYHKHAGFCLETMHHPNSPNQPEFPSTVLRPGETYRQTTVHRFGVL